MANIIKTSVGGAGTRPVTEIVLTATNDLTYEPGAGHVLIVRNPTAASIDCVLRGADSTTVNFPGAPFISVAGGYSTPVPAGAVRAIPLDTVAAYLKGPVTVTGAGLVTVLMRAVNGRGARSIFNDSPATLPGEIVTPTVTEPLRDLNLSLGDDDVVTDLSEHFDGAESYSVSPTGQGVTISGSAMTTSAAVERDATYTVTASKGTGQTVSDAFGLVVATAAPAVKALPSIATAPSAGWGIRRLNAEYTGPLFRAVRPSDSATRIIAQAADGTPDLAGYDAWAGTQAIQIDMVYDQYGTNNLVQATANNRPRFYRADAVRGKLSATLTFGQSFDIPATLTGSGRATTSVGVGFATSPFNGGGFLQLGPTFTSDGGSVIMLGNSSGNSARVRVFGPNWKDANYMAHAHPQVISLAQGAATEKIAVNDRVTSLPGAVDATWVGGSIGRDGLPQFLSGQWYGHVIYPADLADADVQTLRDSLYAMFDIDVSPDVQIIIPGNSIVQGIGSVRLVHNYVRQMIPALSQRADVLNIGRAGHSAAQVYEDSSTYINAFRSERLRNFIVAPEPTNDLDSGGQAQAAWDDAVSQFIADATVGGFAASDILVPTVLPRNWTGSTAERDAKEAQRLAYNTLVRNNVAGMGYTVVDFASIAAMADPFGPNYADGVHPASNNFEQGLEVSGNGYGYMAKLFADVVNARLAA